VMINGIRNALDAMGENGHVRICSHGKGRWVAISIEDTGKGISEKNQDHLFTPFYTTKTDGTGLGLAYARKVVEGMDGTIRLTNRTNGIGAVLTIQLPDGRRK
jgi:signal transduction histidine kinase